MTKLEKEFVDEIVAIGVADMLTPTDKKILIVSADGADEKQLGKYLAGELDGDFKEVEWFSSVKREDYGKNLLVHEKWGKLSEWDGWLTYLIGDTVIEFRHAKKVKDGEFTLETFLATVDAADKEFIHDHIDCILYIEKSKEDKETTHTVTRIK